MMGVKKVLAKFYIAGKAPGIYTMRLGWDQNVKQQQARPENQVQKFCIIAFVIHFII
jgi:hypothetical protein